MDISQYDETTGLPLDKSYLEASLPPFLVDSINTLQESWEKVDRGEMDLHWDLFWCELNADINYAEVEGLISSDSAWYLREKYLRMEKE